MNTQTTQTENSGASRGMSPRGDALAECRRREALAAWEGLLAAPQSRTRLLGAEGERLQPRFVEAYQKLCALPRQRRRALQRSLGRTLSGVALLSALQAPAALANTINVGGGCTLVDAITAANNNAATGGCAAGGGASDTLVLTGGSTHTLASVVSSYYGSDTGLPLIDSTIIIEGNNSTIARSGAAPAFRIFAVGSGGDLTLRDTTVSGGLANGSGLGGGFHNRGTLELTRSTVSGNSAYDGGGIFNKDGTVKVTDSTVENNVANDPTAGAYAYDNGEGGGIYNDTGSVTVTGSLISGNSAAEDGGGVYDRDGTVTIDDCTVTGNNAGFGAGLYESYGSMTVTESMISGNSASHDGGGVYNNNTVVIDKSTVSGNSAYDGGGLYNYTSMTVTNSTISGNSADYGGGGVYNDAALTLTNSTVVDNFAGVNGGGVYVFRGTASLFATLVSGNEAVSDGAEVFVSPIASPAGSVAADEHNLFGHDGLNNASAFFNFTPGASDITATSNGTSSTPLPSILNPTLANNGGPTDTHALVAGSPALDTGLPGCPPPATDQRGVSRPQGAGCDIGAFELEAPPVDVELIYVSSSTGGNVGGVSFADEDILGNDPVENTWTMVLDTSTFGISSTDINGFEMVSSGGSLGPGAASNDVAGILITFNTETSVPGVGTVDDSDIVLFTPGPGEQPPYATGTFSMLFDGSDVGLTTGGEDIDAIGLTEDGELVISTIGTGNVGFTFQDEDLLVFHATSLGENTAGTFELLLDASDVGLQGGDVNATSLNSVVYLSKSVDYSLPGASGDSSDVFKFTGTLGSNTSGSFAPFWDGVDEGFGGENTDGTSVGSHLLVIPGATGADLSIIKTDDEATDPVTVGDEVVYTLTVTNHGPEDATGVEVEDELPDTVDFIGHSCSTGSALASGGIWTWTIGTLTDLATATCDIIVETTEAGSITNNAQVTGNKTDSVPSNNKASESTFVAPLGGGSTEIYVSSSTGGVATGTGGSVSFADEDIIKYDMTTETWSMHFDGSKVITSGDVNGFTVISSSPPAAPGLPPVASGDILLTFNTEVDLPGLGTVDDSDIVKFEPTGLGAGTAGTFSMFFDGSDFGLSSGNEDIDGFAFTQDGELVITMIGNFRVTGAGGSGSLTGKDEDLIVFDGAGFSMYLDASDVSLTGNDVNGVDIDAAGRIFLTKSESADVPGFSGGAEDIFICTPVSLGETSECTFEGFFEGEDNGIGSENLDGISIVTVPAP